MGTSICSSLELLGFRGLGCSEIGGLAILERGLVGLSVGVPAVLLIFSVVLVWL